MADSKQGILTVTAGKNPDVGGAVPIAVELQQERLIQGFEPAGGPQGITIILLPEDHVSGDYGTYIREIADRFQSRGYDAIEVPGPAAPAAAEVKASGGAARSAAAARPAARRKTPAVKPAEPEPPTKPEEVKAKKAKKKDKDKKGKKKNRGKKGKGKKGKKKDKKKKRKKNKR